MKTFYELIDETVQFDFNDVVLNSEIYQYFRDPEPEHYIIAAKEVNKYLMRRIYMQKNVLKWVNLVKQVESEDRVILSFDQNRVSLIHSTGDGYGINLILINSEPMGEDEFFQFSLLHDLDCIDYELYKKMCNFYNSVLTPIFNF